MWILPNKKVLKRPKPVTINGIQYPAAIFRLWSVKELESIGILPYTKSPQIVERDLEQVKQEKLQILNQAVNAYINSHFDTGTQASFTTLYVLSTTSDDVKTQLESVWSWIQAVMIEYYIKKAALQATETLEEVDAFVWDFEQFDSTVPEVHLEEVI
jgi:hypothetical protein